MAPRLIKTPEKVEIKIVDKDELKLPDKGEVEVAPERASQRKQSEMRFLLQVDRQTKGSYPTIEAASAVGLAIKKKYPIVRVSIYDNVETKNTTIELPT